MYTGSIMNMFCDQCARANPPRFFALSICLSSPGLTSLVSIQFLLYICSRNEVTRVRLGQGYKLI